MEKIIAEQFEKYFKEYNDQILWILIAFFILTLLVQFTSNLLLANKIETFKNHLKKNEIMFNKHSELQIECLKNMYNNLVDLHFSYTALINPDYPSHEYFKSSIKSFVRTYNENMNYFHRNKILLTDSIIIQISAMNSRMKIVREIYEKEHEQLMEFEENVGTDIPEILYSEPDNEVSSIQSRIHRINSIGDIMEFENDIKEMRKKVEAYFKQLIK